VSDILSGRAGRNETATEPCFSVSLLQRNIYLCFSLSPLSFIIWIAFDARLTLFASLRARNTNEFSPAAKNVFFCEHTRVNIFSSVRRPIGAKLLSEATARDGKNMYLSPSLLLLNA